MKHSYSILLQPINELDLSNEFKEMAERHDFRNLQDILNWPATLLLMHTDFNYHRYQELRNYLHINFLVKDSQ